MKLFNGQNKELSTLKLIFLQLVQSMQERDWFFLKIAFFQSISFTIFHGVSLILLLHGLKYGYLTPGDLVLILTLNLSLLQILSNFAHYIRDIAEDLGNLKQGLNLLLSDIRIQNVDHAGKLCAKNKEIEFKNVYFSYTDSRFIFNDLSVVIPAGQKVGLVGSSGSGKTTFVNLLLRFYEITAGSISIGGQNIKNVTQESLRKIFTVIPQDPALFHRTVRDNIRYGCFDASNYEIIKAAKEANAHEFIKYLPKGYESLVGEKGVKLSGGQKQKIALSRAFLKKAPILILDEATSQLDSINENLIQTSIKKLLRSNQTLLVIAHRLSTILCMDRILVFSEGRIIGDGTHQELMIKNSLYRNMWDHQINILNDLDSIKNTSTL
jgi:ATP-binding cassette subfamily B protein